MPDCLKPTEPVTAEIVPIVQHELLAKDTKRLRLAVPSAWARAHPGQFFMLRNPRSTDPLIGRAFALYDCDPAANWIDIVYLCKGKFTRSLSALRPGDNLAVWGPLGNSFDDSPTKHLIMVAGGIGQTPFLTLAREALGKQQFGTRRSGYAERVTFCYGARSAEYLAEVDAFQEAGASVLIATEDGSVGPPRRVTDLLVRLLTPEIRTLKTEPLPRLVCCGPEPMMEAVAKIAKEHSLPCQVSLETPMACGIGICFTCVTRVGSLNDWDYRRTCIEGPVFDANQIVW